MDTKIRAKVARILNSREVVITAGSIHGIKIGMLFDILDPKGEDIRDPESGELLGSVYRPKVRVKIVEIQEKISTASTYKTREVNIGGSDLSSIGLLGRSFMPPKWVKEYETLKTTEKTWEDIDEKESFVKVGDPVLQVDETIID
jgi:hypothetical protein